MQIQAKGGSMVLDFYPIKDWNGYTIPDKFLRILTFRGQTQNKRIVSSAIMDEDVIMKFSNREGNAADFYDADESPPEE